MNKKCNKRRLFFAFYPAEQVRGKLVQLGNAELPGCGGRLLAAANVHLTLAFLGSVDDAGYRCACSLGDSVRAQGFELVVDQLGYWRRPRIVWAGCSTTPAALTQLVDQLRAGLGRYCHMQTDDRPYQVHFTLLRKVRTAVPRKMIDQAVSMVVDEFALMESITIENSVRYQVLRSWKLGVHG